MDKWCQLVSVHFLGVAAAEKWTDTKRHHFSPAIATTAGAIATSAARNRQPARAMATSAPVGLFTSWATQRSVMVAAARQSVTSYSVALSACVGGLGLIISFVPGAELGWFGTAAALAAVGLLSPQWPIRLLAITLLIAWSFWAWVGYERGLRYQEYMRARRDISSSSNGTMNHR